MRILGIIGSYREDGVIASLVKQTIKSAAERGAETDLIYLKDKHIEFCTNCRVCTQPAGKEVPNCIFDDDMNGILKQCTEADALVIGAPVNFFALNALTKKFLERLLPFTYWPWGARTGPRLRSYKRPRKSVLISSAAMPGIMGRVLTSSMKSLKIVSRMLGAKPVATIFAGMCAVNQADKASQSALKAAAKAGKKLVK